MLDFRSSTLALAALLAIGSGSASGQTTPLSCTAQSAGTPSIRAEGVAELVGDIIIQCNGGVPTPANENLRQVNFQVVTQPSINITSRQLASAGTGSFSEALLFIDEPTPANQTLCGSGAYPYSVPVGSGQTLVAGNCGAHAGTGNGIGTYDPNVAAPVISTVQTSRGNAYQARQTSNNALIWQGIPFDPPGNLTTRIIRITNVRVNASQLGVPAGSQAAVQLFILTSPSGLSSPIAVPISNPTPTVATAQQSLGFGVIDSQTCLQSQSANGEFAGDSTKPLAAQGANKCDGVLSRLRFSESAFPSAFRRRNTASPTGFDPPVPIRQDTLGVIYQTESGYMKTAANGNRWPLVAANASVVAGNTAGSLGLADQGTRLMARFSNMQSGVQLWVEANVPITSGTTSTGSARLAVTDSSGAGAFQPAATGSSQLGGIAQVPLSGGAGTAVWEVVETDTTAFERVEPRVVVAYISNPSGNVPGPGASIVGGAYASISSSATAMLSRFIDTDSTLPFLAINPVLAAPGGLSPANGATGVSTSVTTSWTHAGLGDSFDVYFGTTNPPAFVTNITSTSYTPPILAPLTTYYWRVIAKRGAQSLASLVFSFTTGGAASGFRFVPVNPCRVVDTREVALGIFGTPVLTGGGVRSFPIPQKAGCNIPANAAAYSINATVVPQGPLSYLTVWPTGQPQPFVSTLNSTDGRIKANAAIVPAGLNGAISAYATNNTELVIDINGYFIDPAADPASFVFYPLAPCRVIDTRDPNGSLGGPIIAGGVSRDIPFLASNCGVPGNAQAYSMNATVVPSGPLSFLTLWPAGQSQPLVSTLNALTGGIVANAAIVKAGVNGAVSAFVSSNSHLVVDINGYFAPPGAANAQRYFPVAPCRLLDTRNPDGEFGGPILVAGAERSYRLPLANCNLPGSAAAFVLNATVVPTNALSFLTLWPFGTAKPLVSTLNALDGAITSNMALIPAGTAGAVASFVTNGTHLVFDTTGYFAP